MIGISRYNYSNSASLIHNIESLNLRRYTQQMHTTGTTNIKINGEINKRF